MRGRSARLAKLHVKLTIGACVSAKWCTWLERASNWHTAHPTSAMLCSQCVQCTSPPLRAPTRDVCLVTALNASYSARDTPNGIFLKRSFARDASVEAISWSVSSGNFMWGSEVRNVV